MRKSSATGGKGKLRTGWSTGACATAALRAAYGALVTGRFADPVTITLPGGERPGFALTRAETGEGWARAAVVKDAGDDPDVTDGAEVVVTVCVGAPGSGIRFAAGEGVGTVTRPGLTMAPGEPAINPGPRAMMVAVVRGLARSPDSETDLLITVSIPGGQALAAQTLNGRLGIVGGLSVLGTTGVVIPFSRAAWIHTIHRGVDVARATGLTHIAGATGKNSAEAVLRLHALPEEALIEMGDFAGGLLKYLRKHPVARLTIAGGFAKLCKLAQGDMMLHSSRSRVDMDALAERLERLGAGPDVVREARHANTAVQVLDMAREQGIPLADTIAHEVRSVAVSRLGDGIDVDVAIFDRSGGMVGYGHA